MYFTILNSSNKPILTAILTHFSIHTSATESHQSRIKYDNEPSTGVDVAYCVILDNVEIDDEEALLAFESNHRLDHTNKFSGNKEQSDRKFYIFIQPKLRAEYSWNITQEPYNTNKRSRK